MLTRTQTKQHMENYVNNNAHFCSKNNDTQLISAVNTKFLMLSYDCVAEVDYSSEQRKIFNGVGCSRFTHRTVSKLKSTIVDLRSNRVN